MTVLKSYDGATWQPVAVGAQGVTGTQGIQGVQGITGSTQASTINPVFAIGGV